MFIQELIAHITSLTSIDEFDLMVDTYYGGLVTSELWATLLQQAAENLSDIRLSLWRKLPGRSKYLSSNYEPPPPPSPPPSKAERSRLFGSDYYGAALDQSRSRSNAYEERRTSRSEGYASKSAIIRKQQRQRTGDSRRSYYQVSPPRPYSRASAPFDVYSRSISYYPLSALGESYTAPPGSGKAPSRSRSLSSSSSASAKSESPSTNTAVTK